MIQWFRKNPKSETKFACIYCGGTEFYQGPSGGAAVNILCANPDCRHWFNDMGPFGVEDLLRVEPTEKEKEEQKRQVETEALSREEQRYQDGRDAYRTGKSSRTLLINAVNGGASGWNVERLCGFIDAMADDVRGKRKFVGYSSTDESTILEAEAVTYVIDEFSIYRNKDVYWWRDQRLGARDLTPRGPFNTYDDTYEAACNVTVGEIRCPDCTMPIKYLSERHPCVPKQK